MSMTDRVPDIWGHAGRFVQARAGAIVIATVIATMLLMVPMIAMAPERQANDTPGGEVFDLSARIQEEMPSANLYTGFIVEAKDGDILTKEELLELYENERALRESSLGREYLVSRYDVDTGRWNEGVHTIADVLDLMLAPHGGLEGADDDAVKVAVHDLLSSPEGRSFRDSFSIKAWNETATIGGRTIVVWHSPAIVINTYSDNAKVERQYAATLKGVSQDSVVKEHYNREVQDLLRGDQRSYRLWGIAIDVNLEAQDEGQVSFMLIFAAVVLILIIVLVIFRSVSMFLLTASGLVMLIIWLKGLSNLVGLNSSLTIDILVPVSILVLGVDYAIHAVHRYEEEKVRADTPRSALGLSVAGVGGALMLAMLTTVVAFGSNIVSDIEQIVGFGVSASLAIISAYWIMGFFLPSARMLIDDRSGKRARAAEKRRMNSRGSAFLGKAVASIARRRKVLLPAVLLLSIGAGYLALQLEAQLDVKEYFDSSSDFVVSLDKLDEHMGDRGGEPAIFYFEGRLGDPEVLAGISGFESSLGDNEMIARDEYTGEVVIYMDILTPIRNLYGNGYAMAVVQDAIGMNLTDLDGDQIPDTPEQVQALLTYIHDHGIPLNSTVMMYDPQQVGEVLWIDPLEPARMATIVMTGVPDTRELRSVQLSEEEFREDMAGVRDASITYIGLTGSGYERERTLSAITTSLNISIAIAIASCFIVLTVLLRSFKFALVTVVPEVLVASWLYAFMFVAGYHLNAVTATIAAISIGVGIDYSVHITARYRQELSIHGDASKALETAARHTGVALTGSAVSTVAGFAIIGFAPMPMFASYGILTAIMIVLAFASALLVLPSLLLLATTKKDLVTPGRT